METYRASRRFTIIMFLLTAASICFAFVHSAMPADMSDDESRGVAELFTWIFNALGIDMLTADAIIRKLAHFAEFSVIGAMLTSCAYAFDRLRPHRFYAQVLLAGLVTAVIDETIQLGSQGRAGAVVDVIIDFGGVLFGGLVMLAAYSIYRRIRGIKR